MNRVEGRHVTVWDRDEPTGWRSGCALLATTFIVGFLFGFFLSAAASRPASATTPQPVNSPTGSVGAAAQVQPSTSPVPSEAPQLANVRTGRTGIIAYADESLGVGYLAIPIGPGHLVTICGPAACWTTISTDAGPAPERLRAGRIADVAVGWWERICGLPRTRGTCRGSWQLAINLPATDTETP